MLSLLTAAIEVFFEFDSARLPEGTSDKLAEIVEFAEQNPEAKIIVDGNADSTGPSVYNVGLSLRRAESVQGALIRMGVDPDRLIMVGYGEDNLRRSEDWLDRRVNVWTTEDPLYRVVDHSLERATAVLWNEPVIAAQIDGPLPTTTAFR